MNPEHRKYQATFLLDPREIHESVETVVEKIKSALQAIGASVENVHHRGSLMLARQPKRDFNSGIFVQVDFHGNAQSTQALHHKLRLEKEINRMMVLAVA